MHYRMFFSSDTWFTASDLFDESTGKTREVTLTIDRVTKGNIVGVGGKKSTKPALHWKERAKSGDAIKPLAIGTEVCSAIHQVCGTSDMAKWPGHQVTLYVGEARVSGEMRPAVRIRPFTAKQQRAARSEQSNAPDADEQREIAAKERAGE